MRRVCVVSWAMACSVLLVLGSTSSAVAQGTPDAPRLGPPAPEGFNSFPASGDAGGGLLISAVTFDFSTRPEARHAPWVDAGRGGAVPTGVPVRRRSGSNEAAFGIGGAGHLLTEPGSEEEPRYGAGAAVAFRASYARCVDTGGSAVCFEIPVDWIPTAKIASPSPTAPQSFSTLVLTPGVRFESDGLPGGFLPLNFIAIGFGAARYVSSNTLLNGTATEPARATTVGIRVDLGLNVRLRERLGLRVGAFAADGDLPEWFQQQQCASGRLGG